jgi:hypothetical protein
MMNRVVKNSGRRLISLEWIINWTSEYVESQENKSTCNLPEFGWVSQALLSSVTLPMVYSNQLYHCIPLTVQWANLYIRILCSFLNQSLVRSNRSEALTLSLKYNKLFSVFIPFLLHNYFSYYNKRDERDYLQLLLIRSKRSHRRIFYEKCHGNMQYLQRVDAVISF